VVALRRALLGAGFSLRSVCDVLGADESLILAPHQAPLVNRRLGDGPLATLIRLFLFGAPVTSEQAARALTPLSVQEAVNVGVVTLGRSRVHGAVRIVPTDRFFLASDLDSDDPTDLPADFVMGVTDSSRLLGSLTVRRPVARALDLGTGCGYQAVLAAQHAEQVVATDLNARALAFTRFNALLNASDNIEVRAGDRFSAVEGETFDLIVSNPPFVISPDRAFTYRDSGLHGDQVSREIVQEAPRFLNRGGLAHLLVSWVHAGNDDRWSEPLRAWVDGSGCDAWFLRKASYDPVAYAVMWNQRLALANQMPKYLAAVDRWTRYFEHLGIAAMGYGGVWLRRREAGAARVRVDELPEKSLSTDAAADMLRLLEMDDRLEALSDAELLSSVVRVPSEQRLEQVLRWRDGTFRTVEASLVRDQGLMPRADLDPALTALLAQMDGARSVREVLERTAQSVGSPASTLEAQAVPALRQMLSYGFLTLAN
jgi:methylase of polypeptide subunit release factors